MMNWKFFASSFLICGVLSHPLLAEHLNESPATQTDKGRPTSNVSFKQDVQDTVLKAIPGTHKNFFTTGLGKNLAQDLFNAGPNNPDASVKAARTMTQLLTTVSDKQWEPAMESVTKKLEEELPELDRKLLNWTKWGLEKIKHPDWTGKNIKDEEEGKKAEAFVKIFSPEWEKKKEENEKIEKWVNKITESSNGDPETQKKLLKEVNHEALATFVNSMEDKDKQKKFLTAMAMRDASGKTLLDLKSGNENLRVFSKNGNELTEAFNKLVEKYGAHNLTQVPAAHQNVTKAWYFNNGAFTPIAANQVPPGFNLSNIQSQQLAAGQQGGQQAQGQGQQGQQPQGQQQGQGAAQPAGGPNDAAVTSILARSCTGCHGPGKQYERKFAINADGTLRNPADKGTILRVATGPTPSMPPPMGGTPLSEAEKTQIQQWAGAVASR